MGALIQSVRLLSLGNPVVNLRLRLGPVVSLATVHHSACERLTAQVVAHTAPMVVTVQGSGCGTVPSPQRLTRARGAGCASSSGHAIESGKMSRADE
jgi:hypothetical protein